MKRSGLRGQSLAEYALMAGLVVVSTIGALSVFGTELTGKTNEVWTALRGNGAATTPGATTAANTATATADAAAPQTGVVLSLGVDNELFDGRYGSAEELFSSLNTMVETGGAQGLTKQNLAYLEQVMQEKLDSGEMKQEEANELLWLADKGYEIAEVHRVVQTVLDTTEPAFLRDTPVTYNGKTYANVEQFTHKNFHISGTMNNFNIKSAFHTDTSKIENGTTLESFVAKYKQLDDEGKFKTLPPDLSLLVDNAAKMIVQLADEVDDTFNGGTKPEELREKIKQKNAETVTRANAQLIETSAGGNPDATNE